MKSDTGYDIVFIGSYTKDTVVSSGRSRVVDGGGFNYGAHAAVLMGLRTGAVTRLSADDVHVVKMLAALGVDVFPIYTPHSTHLELYYPTSNVDERTITVMQTAGSFTPDEVQGLTATAFVINTTRADIPPDIVLELGAELTLHLDDGGQDEVRLFDSAGGQGRKVLRADEGVGPRDRRVVGVPLVAGGHAVVIDPLRHLEPYLSLAKGKNFKIEHVIDTHGHADHVSGGPALAAATGASRRAACRSTGC